jgi:hypothetical protein
MDISKDASDAVEKEGSYVHMGYICAVSVSEKKQKN